MTDTMTAIHSTVTELPLSCKSAAEHMARELDAEYSRPSDSALPETHPHNTYDDGNIPEIDLPKPADATDVIPDEVPRRDGPGGE